MLSCAQFRTCVPVGFGVWPFLRPLGLLGRTCFSLSREQSSPLDVGRSSAFGPISVTQSQDFETYITLCFQHSVVNAEPQRPPLRHPWYQEARYGLLGSFVVPVSKAVEPNIFSSKKWVRFTKFSLPTKPRLLPRRPLCRTPPSRDTPHSQRRPLRLTTNEPGLDPGTRREYNVANHVVVPRRAVAYACPVALNH
jgi:hypothetical protein